MLRLSEAGGNATLTFTSDTDLGPGILACVTMGDGTVAHCLISPADALSLMEWLSEVTA